jgi:MoxR-like ATPase
MSKQTQVNLNIDELGNTLTHIINNNRIIQAEGKLPVAANVVGQSGIGKTSLMLQLAKKLNLDAVKINLAQIQDLGDLVGFPVRQFQLCKYELKDDFAEKKYIDVPKVIKVIKPVTIYEEVEREVQKGVFENGLLV